MKQKINCNLSNVFCQFGKAEELKAAANDIREQLIQAFNARMEELKTASKNIEVTVTKETEQPAKQGKSKERVKKIEEVAAKTSKQSVKQEPAPTQTDSDAQIAITDTKAIAKLGLTFEKYNEKCWVLRGNTKPIRSILKDKFKGVFNGRLTGGEGWVIRTDNVNECAKALKLKIKTA